MSNAVAKRGETALAKNEDLRAHAGAGTEGLGKDDIRPPRLMLAQAGNPQMKKNDPSFIKDLREGNLFNDLTGDVYGDGPVPFIVITFLGKRAIEFYSEEENKKGLKGVKDFDVPLDDERLQFKDGPDGQRIKPVATLLYEYLFWLPKTSEVVAVSMKNTQVKVAKKLNSLLKYPLNVDGEIIMDPPSWARTFALGTAMQGDGTYNWANYTVDPSGVTEPETRTLLAGLNAAYKTKNVVIEVEEEAEEAPKADDDTPF